MTSSFNNILPAFSKYFCIGLVLGFGVLFYIRRQIQGYYRDYTANISLKDLNGKTAIITGGNSGLGLGSAIHLARLNAKVIIACRNSQKASAAVEYIKSQSGNTDIHYMSLNLSDLKSIETFASDINNNSNIDIDYLILNAGIAWAVSSPLSNDGIGQIFQSNYLGHWYLTNLLLDRIKATAHKRWNVNANQYGPPVRIVSVSSGAHSSTRLPLDNDAEWGRFVKGECGYGQSKLLQIVHMKQLQAMLHEYDQMIQCVSVTPGAVRSNIGGKFKGFVKMIVIGLYPLIWYLTRDIMSGSQVVLHVVTNDKTVNGGYYSNCRLKASKGANGCSNDTSVWDKAWKRTDGLIKSLQNNTFE